MDDTEWVNDLKRQVTAAEQEVTTAVVLHESWRPTTYDKQLLDRMGESFATHTFHIVRWALRREVLLALLRVWDKQPKAVNVAKIIADLRKPGAVEGLICSRKYPEPSLTKLLAEHLRGSLPEQIAKVGALSDKYIKDGESAEVMRNLLKLRNVYFAHRQAEPQTPTGNSVTDDQIETFFLDTCEIVENLMSIVCATSLSMKDTAGIYAHYAKFFWASARGERTPGHPQFPQLDATDE